MMMKKILLLSLFVCPAIQATPATAATSMPHIDLRLTDEVFNSCDKWNQRFDVLLKSETPEVRAIMVYAAHLVEKTTPSDLLAALAVRLKAADDDRKAAQERAAKVAAVAKK
jgi:hypothetical protein